MALVFMFSAKYRNTLERAEFMEETISDIDLQTLNGLWGIKTFPDL